VNGDNPEAELKVLSIALGFLQKFQKGLTASFRNEIYLKVISMKRRLAVQNTLNAKILEVLPPQLQREVYSAEYLFYGDPN